MKTLIFFAGVRKDGGGQVQTSLTDLKPPQAPNHSKRIADIHGKLQYYWLYRNFNTTSSLFFCTIRVLSHELPVSLLKYNMLPSGVM